MRSASEILDEIRRIKGINSDTALGALLGGVKQTTVSSWRSRNSIPYDEIIAFCVKEGLSIDSLLDRNESTILAEPAANYQLPRQNDPQIREMASIMARLDAKSKAELLKQAKEKEELLLLRQINQSKSEVITALEPCALGQQRKPESSAEKDAAKQEEKSSAITTKSKKVLR